MASGLLPKSPVSSSLCDEVPHIFIPKSHLEPREFLISSAKRLLQQYLPLADNPAVAAFVRFRKPAQPAETTDQCGHTLGTATTQSLTHRPTLSIFPYDQVLRRLVELVGAQAMTRASVLAASVGNDPTAVASPRA